MPPGALQFPNREYRWLALNKVGPDPLSKRSRTSSNHVEGVFLRQASSLKIPQVCWWNCYAANVARRINKTAHPFRGHRPTRISQKRSMNRPIGHRVIKNISAILQSTLGCTKAGGLLLTRRPSSTASHSGTKNHDGRSTFWRVLKDLTCATNSTQTPHLLSSPSFFSLSPWLRWYEICTYICALCISNTNGFPHSDKQLSSCDN